MFDIIDFLEGLFHDPNEGIVKTKVIETAIVLPVIKLEDYSVDVNELFISMPDEVRRHIHDWITYEIGAAVIADNPELVSDIKMINALSLGHHDADGTFVGSSQASLISATVISKHNAWKEDEVRQILGSMEKAIQERIPTVQYVFKMETVELAK